MSNFSLPTIDYEALLKEFKKLLKKRSLKFTIQREVILKTLYNCQEHLTPEGLHDKIQNNYPELKVGIATVYRTLSLLEESGLVTSLSFGADGKKYELGAKDHHDHMICTECGRITEFFDEEIESRQEVIASKNNFKIIDHSMQIYGICAKCQKES